MLDAIGIKTAKVFLVDLTTTEAKEFQFNPAELGEVFGTKWVMFESPGLSHQRPQFVHTDTVRWKFTAIFDQFVYQQEKAQRRGGIGARLVRPADDALGVGGASEVESWRNFLISLTVPRRVPAGGTNRIAAASPTPVHFEWPGLVSTTIRVQTVSFAHQLFRSGSSRARLFTAALDVFEDPAERMYADDVRRYGTMRPWASRAPASRGKR